MGWLKHCDSAIPFARRALFVGACEADAGPATASAFLRSVMSHRVHHRLLHSKKGGAKLIQFLLARWPKGVSVNIPGGEIV